MVRMTKVKPISSLSSLLVNWHIVANHRLSLILYMKCNPAWDGWVFQLLHNSIRIVQITRAESHSLKLEYVRSLNTTLGNLGFLILSFVIVVVFPRGNVERFRLPPSKIRSHLKEWNWKPEDLQTVAI